MEDEFASENILPFAKRSQIVKRFIPEPILPDPPLLPPEERYGPEFWERLIRQPSVYKTDVSSTMPVKISSFPIWRTNVEWGSQSAPGLEPLPSPSELCRGKKRKQKSQLVNERRVMSVRQHIQELWRKQSSIDQLKSMKWGGYNASKFGIKEEPQTDVSSMDCEQDDFSHFLDNAAECTEQNSVPFSTSPQCAPVGVVFPWMTPQDDETPCYLDSSLEGWGVGGLFYEE